mmetsp:Transcript_29952/g.33586  ORF Transcript_29952/g.33586 Transcript_29952/m.33586 type:complete len:494 (+) Transcript_29952:610-2091(+)
MLRRPSSSNSTTSSSFLVVGKNNHRSCCSTNHYHHQNDMTDMKDAKKSKQKTKVKTKAKEKNPSPDADVDVNVDNYSYYLRWDPTMDYNNDDWEDFNLTFNDQDDDNRYTLLNNRNCEDDVVMVGDDNKSIKKEKKTSEVVATPKKNSNSNSNKNNNKKKDEHEHELYSRYQYHTYKVMKWGIYAWCKEFNHSYVDSSLSSSSSTSSSSSSYSLSEVFLRLEDLAEASIIMPLIIHRNLEHAIQLREEFRTQVVSERKATKNDRMGMKMNTNTNTNTNREKHRDITSSLLSSSSTVSRSEDKHDEINRHECAPVISNYNNDYDDDDDNDGATTTTSSSSNNYNNDDSTCNNEYYYDDQNDANHRWILDRLKNLSDRFRSRRSERVKIATNNSSTGRIVWDMYEYPIINDDTSYNISSADTIAGKKMGALVTKTIGKRTIIEDTTQSVWAAASGVMGQSDDHNDNINEGDGDNDNDWREMGDEYYNRADDYLLF